MRKKGREDYWFIKEENISPASSSLKTVMYSQLDVVMRVQDRKLNRPKTLSRVFTIVSLLSLCLIVALTFFVVMPEFSAQKQIVGLIFDIICLMGAVAAVAPSRCSKQFHHTRSRDTEPTRTDTKDPIKPGVTIRGHHPTCRQFTSHVLRIGERTYCAGCLGLFTGALAALVGSLVYSLDGIEMGSLKPFVFWVGFVGVAAGLLQYAKPLTVKASVHFILNVAFVFGSFLFLIGVIELNGNLMLHVYLLATIAYWILTRILLSSLEHQKICAVCGRVSCTHY